MLHHLTRTAPGVHTCLGAPVRTVQPSLQKDDSKVLNYPSLNLVASDVVCIKSRLCVEEKVGLRKGD